MIDLSFAGCFWNRHLDKRADSMSLGSFPSWPSDSPGDKKDDHKAFYVRRLYRIMTVANVHGLTHKHTVSIGGLQCNKATNRCDLGQLVVEQGFNSANDWNLSVFSVAFTTAWLCQRLHSEDTLISRLLVSAAALALMKTEMKRRREGKTERLACFLSVSRGNTAWAGVWERQASS